MDSSVSEGAVWLSGGTGLLGQRLIPRLRDAGVPLRLVSRRPEGLTPAPGCEVAGWDGTSPEPERLRGCRAVIHLAGEPVFGGFPSKARLARIWDSRVLSTRALVESMAGLPETERPKTLICASAVGYYGDRGDEELAETAAPGEGLLADLCVAWEAEAQNAAELGVRVVNLRFGIVLARDGGALALMAPIFKLGFGGKLGDGRQWFPWVHVDDAVAQIEFVLNHEEVRGAVNVVAPEGARNESFTKALGRVVGRPTWFAVPGFAVRAVAGPLSDELLGSKHVIPAELGESCWLHPTLEEALRTELG